MSQTLKIWLHNNPYAKKSAAKPRSDAILQQLLQNSLNTSQPLEIFKNPNGKPFINEPLYFSHSNSRNLYAYIICEAAEVAIDVEWIRPDYDVMKLASRYFHPDEIQHLKQLNTENQSHRFFQMWTRKEAWCKLEGGNLWSYLKHSTLVDQSLEKQTGTRPYFTEISDIDGFVGAVASSAEINHVWINSIA